MRNINTPVLHVVVGGASACLSERAQIQGREVFPGGAPLRHWVRLFGIRVWKFAVAFAQQNHSGPVVVSARSSVGFLEIGPANQERAVQCKRETTTTLTAARRQ